MSKKKKKAYDTLYSPYFITISVLYYCCQLISYILTLSGFYLYLTAFHYLISIPKSALANVWFLFYF